MASGGVKVRMRAAGAKAVMNSAEVQSKLLSMAESIKEQADGMGGEYAADVRAGRTRAHAMVKTTDARSMAANAKHNALLKALGSGRG